MPFLAMRDPRRLFRCRSGAVAIQIALLMTLLMGMGALGIEMGELLLMHRVMQTAADAAAYGGAIALITGYPAAPATEAQAAAAAAGFVNGSNDTTVTVNIPPTMGPHAGNDSAVEVIVDQPQTLALASLFGPAAYDVGARAVALASQSYEYCMLALDSSASGALQVINNSEISNPNCGVAVDSSSATALQVINNSAIEGPVLVHGGWSLINDSTLANPQQAEYGASTADPYANVSVGTIPACTSQSGTVVNNATATLSPGHFCDGFDFANGATVTLTAGTYYVDEQLSMANNVTVTGNGVTLVINGNYAISIVNGASLTLTAPSSGNFAGLAIYGSRTATSSITQTFANGDSVAITGVIYFPNQIVDLVNSIATGTTPCTQLVAREIEVANNVWFGNQCSGTGVRPIGTGTAQVVE